MATSSTKIEKKLLKSEDFIARITTAAEEQGLKLSKKDAKSLVSSVFSVLSDALEEQHQIQIKDFGTFSTKYRAARVVSVPGTDKKVDSPAKHVVAFKAATRLADKANKVK